MRKTILRKPRLRNALAVATAAGIALTGSLGVARPAAQAASPVTIIFWNGPDTTGTVPTLISNFNKMEAGRIKVVLQTQSSDTGQYFVRDLAIGWATPACSIGGRNGSDVLHSLREILSVRRGLNASSSPYVFGHQCCT